MIALPTSWQDLERCLVTTLATENALSVLGDESSALFKQKQLRDIVCNAKLDRSPFDCIFTDLEDEIDEAEVASCVEVWTHEVATAYEDSLDRLQFTIQTNLFESTDVSAATAWVKSSADVFAQQQKIAELGDDVEPEAKQNAHETLVTMQGTVDFNLRLVHKARRAKHLKDRKKQLLSAKRPSIECGSVAFRLSPLKIARSDSESNEIMSAVFSYDRFQSTETPVQDGCT